MSQSTVESHAVVIGASMAGLLAARILSEHFDRVTLIDRDKLPDEPDFRGSVPQARHIHALLAQGQQIMEDLFPGLANDFIAMGAPRIVWGRDTASLTPGGWVKRFDSGLESNIVTRIRLEWQVRQYVAALKNVNFLTHRDVQSLIASDDGMSVIGLKVQSRGHKSTQTLYADLIVDASGRESKTPEWLQQIGYDAPEQTVINAYLGYATRWYEAPADFTYDWKSLTLLTRPNEGILRGGGIFQVEGNCWITTLVGMSKDYPPTDEEGFLAFARSLSSPTLYEAIKSATPISPIYGYRRTENRWRHYERLARFPERLIVMGDAFCSFNPVYGQGMTIAALEARELAAMLKQRGRHNLAGLSSQFQKRLPKVVENAWLMATGEDLRYPATEGNRPGKFARFIQKYIDRVLTILPYDNHAALTFLQVMNLTRPPTALLHPRILFTVLHYYLLGFEKDSQVNAPTQGYKTHTPQPTAGD
jgi:2-polyprenyl-6-methoxyphenol hydroxylase-like FAD-dependent oxidoreductase